MREKETETPRDDDDVRFHLRQIERHAAAARNGSEVLAPGDITPWDFELPGRADLRQLRKECGLDFDEVAEKTEYSENYIRNIEGGSKAPGRQFIQTMLRLYRREWPRRDV